jgi:hypothetical protein
MAGGECAALMALSCMTADVLEKRNIGSRV